MYLHSEVPNTRSKTLLVYVSVRIAAPCVSTEETWRGYHKLSSRSAHPGGVQVLYLDSSVRFVDDLD